MRASMNPPNHLASLEARPKRTRKLSTFLAELLVAIFMTGQLTAQSPASVTLVKAGRLLDPRTGNVLSPAAVLIESGKRSRKSVRLRECRGCARRRQDHRFG